MRAPLFAVVMKQALRVGSLWAQLIANAGAAYASTRGFHNIPWGELVEGGK